MKPKVKQIRDHKDCSIALGTIIDAVESGIDIQDINTLFPLVSEAYKKIGITKPSTVRWKFKRNYSYYLKNCNE